MKLLRWLKLEIEYINLPVIDSKKKGKLSFMEAGKDIPFEIKRIYYIYDIEDLNIKRGYHAHKTLKQIIFCLNGSFILELDNGFEKKEIFLNKPNKGVLIDFNIWHNMKNFNKNVVIMVVASDYYNENDYIRNYNEFIEYINKKNNARGIVGVKTLD